MRFGITQSTADWILGKPGLLDQLHHTLVGAPDLATLRNEEFVAGPVRLSASPAGALLVMWHSDYLTGTGDESWGFVQLNGGQGLFSRADISREVLERCLYVINQRLQGYLIDGAFIHRSYPNGAHTCLAGRGSDARQVSIGYVERDVQVASSAVHAVICVGPEYDLMRLSADAAAAAEDLDELVTSAGALIAPTRKRKAASPSVLPELRSALTSYLAATTDSEYAEVKVPTGDHEIADRDTYRTYGWTYHQWMAPDSPLSPIQRRLLWSDAVEHHPIRIVGPGGSGKTLLMQLLALRRIEVAKSRGVPIRILYLAHNTKMAETVKHRFSVLQGLSSDFADGDRLIRVQTLAQYGREELSLDESHVIDPDAHEAKEFQLEVLDRALQSAIGAHVTIVDRSPLLREVRDNPALQPMMVRLVMAEISTAIKGHGLANDEKRYVQSERRLSRLHGVLDQNERQVIFSAFLRYHREIFEGFGVLDSDDVALSLLGKLRTPIWELKRRELGFNYVFVDETQLFNENERRVLPLLTKGETEHVPIVLALDEAQDIYGQTSAGLSTIGIENVTNESLASIHRSTRAIVRLAFFVIQRSTDLFGPDFPDFTGIADSMEDDNHSLAARPRIEVMPEGQSSLGRSVVKQVRALRKKNLWRLAVICYAEQYWSPLLEELRKSDLPVRVLEHRGERLPATEPVVALCRPSVVGGQEFDGVILVGLEQGLVPPRVLDNDALAVAVEQQMIRELYLGITRARYQVVVMVSKGAAPTGILREAANSGLLEY